MIYYVEDDVNIRDLLVYAMKQTGYEAMGFPEGSAFEKAMAHGPLPDLILLDIMLPGQDDGWALLQKLKSHQRTMACRLYTSHRRQRHGRRGMRYRHGLPGAEGFRDREGRHRHRHRHGRHRRHRQQRQSPGRHRHPDRSGHLHRRGAELV